MKVAHLIFMEPKDGFSTLPQNGFSTTSSVSDLKHLLLRWNNRFFKGFGWSYFDHDLRRNLNLLARGWVSAFTGFSFDREGFADAWEV